MIFFSVVREPLLSLYLSLAFAGNADSSTPSVTADSVRTYLGEHPDFLDSYIEQHIPSNTIEQWICKRSGKSSSIPITIVTSSSIRETRAHKSGLRASEVLNDNDSAFSSNRTRSEGEIDLVHHCQINDEGRRSLGLLVEAFARALF